MLKINVFHKQKMCWILLIYNIGLQTVYETTQFSKFENDFFIVTGSVDEDTQVNSYFGRILSSEPKPSILTPSKF